MIARDAELAQLAEALAGTVAGCGGLFLLAGEAGVGKTTLARAAMSATGLETITAAASATSSAPYAPLVSILRQLVRLHPDLAAAAGHLRPWLHRLLPELGESSPADHDDPLSEVIRVVLEAAGRRRPIVVLLDDLQWADAATLELLSPLAGWLEAMPISVLAAYRSEELARGHPLRQARTDLRRAGRLRELVVEPLDERATAALVADALGEAPSAALATLLHDRTQGVPFLVEELISALNAAGSLSPGPAGLELQVGSAVPLPETVRDVVRMRMEVLSARAIASLQAAAVVGGDVELGLLAELGEDEGVDEAAERGFVTVDLPGALRFRHDLTREAVYADISWPRRRRLHREVARILPTRGSVSPQVLADHWLAAGAPEKARPLLLEAADAAVALHAHRDAVAMLRTALDLWPGDDAETTGRHSALRQLAVSAHHSGELAESAHAWEQLIATLPRSAPLTMAEALVGLASVHELLHGFDKATRARTEAARCFQEAGRASDATVQLLTAAWRVALRDSTQAVELVERAGEAAEDAHRGDLEVRCLSLRAFVLGLGGERDGATNAVRKSLRDAVAGGHIDEAVEAQWVLGTLANHWGDYRTAEAAFDSAVDVCDQHGIEPLASTCRACLGIALFNRGEWDRAVEVERSVLAGEPRADAEEHALLVLGLISAARGASRRGRSLLTRAAVLARPARPRGNTVLQSLAGLALLDELDGVDNGRWRDLVEAEPPALRQNYALWVRRATTFAAGNGDLALAKRSSELLADWATSYGTSDTSAAFAHALGEISLGEGRKDAAVDEFGRAVELVSAMDAPFELAWTRTRAAAAFHAAGDRDAAAEQLVAAYRTFRRLGARPFATRAAAQLEAIGENIDERLGRRAAADLANGGLTRREREVLQLVAQGHTNRDIAAALVVSTRTIDMHVRNLLMKLGARTRTEAVARAGDLGLLA